MNLLSNYLAKRYSTVSAHDFYRDLFPIGSLDEKGAFTKGKYAGIALCIDSNSKVKRYMFFNDLAPIDTLVQSDDFVVISPVSYAGKSSNQRLARDLFSITFDLDGIKIDDSSNPIGLMNLIHQMESENNLLPKATYIVCSGNGLHLYYLLDNPLHLYSNNMKQLHRLRKELTKRIWNEYVTNLSTNPQYESCTQGFRAVGSIAKDGKQRVIAFKYGERVSIDYLNEFVSDENKITQKRDSLRMSEAKNKYPEWYERRIVLGQQKNTWTTKPDLYYWWLRKIKESATCGHRYFCIMALAIYARKAGIPRDQLENDALSLVPFLDDMTEEENNHFDESDVVKALEAYRATYITFPRATIEELTGIEIPPNKRNGRKREQHMKYLNGINAVRRGIGENLNAGRPSKQMIIQEYARENPTLSKSQIAKDLGVSRTTVVKWLNG